MLQPEARCSSAVLVAVVAGLAAKGLLAADPAFRSIKMKVCVCGGGG